jgi:hypothetical protein
MKIAGAVFIGEVAGIPLTVASPNASDCRFYWSPDGTLPLVHPVQSHIPRLGHLQGNMSNIGRYDAPSHQFDPAKGKVNLGDQWGWRLKPIIIPKGPGRLYVIGQVVYNYRDGRKIVMFARWYDPSRHRFLPDENSDYESAD